MIGYYPLGVSLRECEVGGHGFNDDIFHHTEIGVIQEIYYGYSGASSSATVWVFPQTVITSAPLLMNVKIISL